MDNELYALERQQDKAQQARPSLLGVRGQGLTDRELWLMQRAWAAGRAVGNSGCRNYNMHDWLNDSAADGVTVAMVLEKEAP